jgi:UDP-glucose 4-epimerase
MRDSRVVILGASGFIGGALAEYLGRAGREVVGYSSKTLDLRRPEALAALDGVLDRGVTLVVASAITPDKGRTLDALEANLQMAINLARYLGGRSLGRCVYFSSDAVYPFGDEAVTEASPVEPADNYALAKYAGERVLQGAADAGGLPLLVLRPTGVFGPGDSHNSYGPNRFVRSIVGEGSVRLFGAGEETRDHIFIDDLARLTVGLIDADASGLYNLATGESRSFGSVVEELREIAPDEFRVERAPRAGGGSVTHRRFDVDKLRGSLPEATFTPFRDGLRQTLEAAQGAKVGGVR